MTTAAREMSVWRGPRLAVAMLGGVIVVGTLGFRLIEGWSIWDAFYMTVTTVATVGYREVHPLSFPGQVFTVLLILGGVGTAFYTATLLATVVVEGGLHRRFEQRRFNRMLEQISGHFIVCGYGRIGSIIVAELDRQGIPFVVIERSEERMHTVMERGWLALAADASQETVLEHAGIRRARGLITARVMQPGLFIIARVESDDAEHKLRRAGADRVISPYHIGASHIVQTALRPTVVDFMQLATSSEYLDLSMEQVRVAADSPMAGVSLVDAGIRQKFGVIIVGIKRGSGDMEFNPPPEAIIQAGDELVVLGRPQSVKQLEETVTA
jgi:voltage-gated potassium channel